MATQTWGTRFKQSKAGLVAQGWSARRTRAEPWVWTSTLHTGVVRSSQWQWGQRRVRQGIYVEVAMILPAVSALGYLVCERIVWVLLSWLGFFNLASLLFSWQTGPCMAVCFLLICLPSIAQWFIRTRCSLPSSLHMWKLPLQHVVAEMAVHFLPSFIVSSHWKVKLGWEFGCPLLRA